MLKVKVMELALTFLHVGGLAGAAMLLHEGRLYAAIALALVASVCILLLAGAGALAELLIRRLLQRQTPPKLDTETK